MRNRILVLIGLCLLLGFLAAINNHKIFNRPVGDPVSGNAADTASVVNTYELAPDIIGYGGPLPVNIHLTGNRIDSIEILPNSETPGFLNRLYTEGLVDSWNGKTLEEADTMKIDAVSGATFSSKALIANVKAGVKYALDEEMEDQSNGVLSASDIAKLIIILVVIAFGAIVPLFTKKKFYRIIQQLLNIAILGFWGGTFIDYAFMLNFFSNGLPFSLSGLIALILLIVALLYPVFGAKGHYCNWICPYGSLQDITAKIPAQRIKLTKRTADTLQWVRRILWTVLIVLLATGWGAGWIDYEIFTAFIVEAASWTVIAVGIIFVILSIFIPRAFCRFVCPTGTILKSF